MDRNKFRTDAARAMMDPERYCLAIQYQDAKGNVTRRMISPVRFVDDRSKLMALCLGREDARVFLLDRIQQYELIDARQVVAPVPVIEEERP